MRRLSAKQKERLIRLQLERWHRDLKRRHGSDSSMRGRNKRRKQAPAHRDGALMRHLTVPRILDLYEHEHAAEAHQLFWQLRDQAITRRKIVRLDFSKTTLVKATAMLNLLAEIDRAQKIRNDKSCIRCIPPRNGLVRQVFRQIGLADMLGITVPGTVSSPSVTFWTYHTDTTAGGDVAGPLLHKIKDRITDETTERLFVAVTEALTNAVHHSSIAERSDGIPVLKSRWWMFAGMNDKEFVIVVCDLGIGIPESLELKWREQVRAIFRRLELGNSDDAYIRAAMELHRTRTGYRYRGKGMAQLKEALEQAQDGHLVVNSNRGVYTYKPAASKPEQFFSLKHGIGGTTIEWSIPLGQAGNIAAL